MKYVVTVSVSGWEQYEIEAESVEEARRRVDMGAGKKIAEDIGQDSIEEVTILI